MLRAKFIRRPRVYRRFSTGFASFPVAVSFFRRSTFRHGRADKSTPTLPRPNKQSYLSPRRFHVGVRCYRGRARTGRKILLDFAIRFPSSSCDAPGRYTRTLFVFAFRIDCKASLARHVLRKTPCYSSLVLTSAIRHGRWYREIEQLPAC